MCVLACGKQLLSSFLPFPNLSGHKTRAAQIRMKICCFILGGGGVGRLLGNE